MRKPADVIDARRRLTGEANKRSGTWPVRRALHTTAVNLIISDLCSEILSSCTISGEISLPGSFAGMVSNPEFNRVKQPFAAGDVFVFATDGILDQLPQIPPLPLPDFDKTVAALLHISQQPTRRDDCTALCIRVK